MNKLLENNKFIVGVFVVNVFLIVLLIGAIIFSHTATDKRFAARSGAGSQPVNEKMDIITRTHVAEADRDIVSTYEKLLAGEKYDLGNGVKFCFDENGEYSGFFDSSNTNVSGYFYEISIKNGEKIYLNIFNGREKNRVVTYEIKFDTDGNILLDHPDLSESILLKHD